MRVDPADNTVNLAASEGPTSTLMAHRLLHLEDSSVLIPPQLSCPAWTGMRRATIRYKSFIRFIALYAPPDKSEVDITTHQLGSIQNLVVPEPAVLLSLADQLENLKAMHQPSLPRLLQSLVRRRAPKRKLQRKLSQRRPIFQGNITNPVRIRVGRGIARPRNLQPPCPVSTT